MEELYQSTVENLDPIKAKVTGTIPGWLEGSLYRNGPSKFEFGNDKFNHWFDGMSLVHRFHISKGEVTYYNRYLNSTNYEANKAANRIVVGAFGTAPFPDPCKTLYQRFFSYFQPPRLYDNTLVHVFPIGDKLFTATETYIMNRIDPETLERLDELDLKKLVSVLRATAHPHIDTDGTLYNLGASIAGGYKYNIIKMSPVKNTADGSQVENVEIVAQIPTCWRFHPSYHHSFAMSEHYFMFVEQPMVINVFKILTSRLRGTSFNESLQWWPGYQTKLHIIDRRTGQHINPDVDYVTKTMFVFHHINAYEEDGHLVVDLCGFEDGTIINNFKTEKMQQAGAEEFLSALPRAQCWRFVLPLNLKDKKTDENLITLKTNATAVLQNDQTVYCQHEVLHDDLHLEFPQINYGSFNGKIYKYMYACGCKKTFTDSLVKLDVTSRELKTWYTEGHYPSEPVFVSAPDPKSEDDGVVLSLVLTTGPSRYAYLLVLDAKSWNELARAEVDVKIGRDTHGSFIKT